MEKKVLIGLGIAAVLALILIFARNPMADNQNGSGKHVILETNLGNIEIALLEKDAPKTTENFEKLVSTGFYDGILFHRVIPNFMIQGGDPLTKEFPSDWARHGRGGPGYVFDDERNQVRLERGVVAMANAGVQNGRGTNGSQFFIITAPVVDWLNVPGAGWHTPFGRIVSGLDVVTKIEQTRRDPNDHPLEDVKIIKAYLK